MRGAFLKSLAYNGNVAVVESQFGFAQELVNKDLVLMLSNDPFDAARMITDYLECSVNKSEKVIKWLIEYYKTNKTQNVFNSVEEIE